MYEKGTPCGIIIENGDYSVILCNETTGECFFQDPMTSYYRLISELSVENPIEVDPNDVLDAMNDGAFGDCMGVIYTEDGLYKLLDDTTVIKVSMEEMSSSEGDPITVDIYGDYDDVDD